MFSQNKQIKKPTNQPKTLPSHKEKYAVILAQQQIQHPDNTPAHTESSLGSGASGPVLKDCGLR